MPRNKLQINLHSQTHSEDEPGQALRLYISVGTVILVSIVVSLILLVRSTKINGYMAQARGLEKYFCLGSAVKSLAPLASELEADWEAYVLNLGLKLPPHSIGTLNFHDAEWYLQVDSCIQAMQLVDRAKSATTDNEKIAIYNEAGKLQETAIETAKSMYQSQASLAKSCMNAYVQVHTDVSISPQTEQTIQIVQRAELHISKSEWSNAMLYLNAYSAIQSLPTTIP